MREKLRKVRQGVSQLRTVFAQTRQADRRLVPILVAIMVAVPALMLGLGLLLGSPVLFAVVGVVLAMPIALIVFGRRAQRAMLTSIQGHPGAAAMVLEKMRGAWLVSPAVAATRKQEFVHRVVGRPGVIVVGEGTSARVSALLKQEHRRIARAVGDVPVHEVRVGTGEGQVPLTKLQTHLTKLPRAIKAKEVGPLNTRLSALGGERLPMPKGPLPKQLRGKLK